MPELNSYSEMEEIKSHVAPQKMRIVYSNSNSNLIGPLDKDGTNALVYAKRALRFVREVRERVLVTSKEMAMICQIDIVSVFSLPLLFSTILWLSLLYYGFRWVEHGRIKSIVYALLYWEASIFACLCFVMESSLLRVVRMFFFSFRWKNQRRRQEWISLVSFLFWEQS